MVEPDTEEDFEEVYSSNPKKINQQARGTLQIHTLDPIHQVTTRQYTVNQLQKLEASSPSFLSTLLEQVPQPIIAQLKN